MISAELCYKLKVPVVDFLKSLGRIVVMQVPKEVKQVFDKLRKKVKSDVLAASTLAAVARKRTLMDTVATVLEDDLRLVKAGESYAMIRAKPFTVPRFQVSSLAAGLLIGLVIGGALGYVFGSTWAVSPSPPPSAAQAAYTPAQMPPPPTQTPVGPTYTPAQPPPVPANTTTSPPYTPAQAPPPPAGGG